MSERVRLIIARTLGGVSYNLAACAYVLILAVFVSVLLPVLSDQTTGEQGSFSQNIVALPLMAHANVATMALGLLVAFLIGALSLLLVIWVPVKIAQLGSRAAQRLSSFIFTQPLSGKHMLIAKLLLYGPAIIVLIILTFIFTSELMFQLMIAGTACVLAATILAALRLAVAR